MFKTALLVVIICLSFCPVCLPIDTGDEHLKAVF